MKYTICLLLLFAGSGSLFGQGTKVLSLQDAVQLSLQNSKQVKTTAAKLQEAAAQLHEALNNRYPDINVSGAYMRLNSPDVNLKMKLGSDSAQGNGAQNAIKVNEVAYGMATASLPLFAGLRIQNGIQSARYLKKAAELDLQNDKEAAIQNTIEAYYNLYKAQAAVKLVQENLKEANRRVTDFTNLEQNGIIARNDLLKAQLQQSNVSLALLDAQHNEAIANFNMDLMLGLDEKTELVLDTVLDTSEKEIQSIAQLEQTAVDNRADYLALLQREDAAHYGVKAARGAYYPSLALTGGYVALYVPNLVTVTNALNVGVGLKYNLADLYKNGARVKEAKAREQQLYWSAQQMNDGLRMQIHQAYQNYLESLKKIEVYQKAVEQAKENYRITKNKYDNALATTTDLLDADVSQLQASMDFEFAKADAVTAYTKLFATAGVLSQKFNEQK